MKATVAINIRESCVDDTPADDGDWDFEGAAVLVEVERVGAI